MVDWSFFSGVIITLFLVALFSGLEVAFLTANRLSIELRKKQGFSSGRILSNFIEHPARFLGTTLVGFTISFIVYALMINRMLEPLWEKAPAPIQRGYLRLLLEVSIASMVILFFVFISKGIFRANNNGLLVFFARIAQFFYGIFSPIAHLFVRIAEWILKYLFDLRINERKEAFTRMDPESFIQQARENGEDHQDLNTELFENALSLPNVKVRECLVPRKEIIGIDTSVSVEQARKKLIENRLSKLVVYDKNIDNIVGYVHQLDFFNKPAELRSILISIPAVPESMGVTDLINQLTRQRKSMAWVVDEFGGTSGIVTMEDLLEEIFGEIQDEYDTEEFVERQIAENEFIFSGRLELDYLQEKYDFNFDHTEAETLSGFIVEHHETIPKAKERIIIGNFEFDVLNVNETRIETVKMKLLS
ncbi:MAG: hemolysin family protein [Chitinophagaceae bacterium]